MGFEGGLYSFIFLFCSIVFGIVIFVLYRAYKHSSYRFITAGEHLLRAADFFARAREKLLQEELNASNKEQGAQQQPQASASATPGASANRTSETGSEQNKSNDNQQYKRDDYQKMRGNLSHDEHILQKVGHFLIENGEIYYWSESDSFQVSNNGTLLSCSKVADLLEGVNVH